jgi:hypothetical protein
LECSPRDKNSDILNYTRKNVWVHNFFPPRRGGLFLFKKNLFFYHFCSNIII